MKLCKASCIYFIFFLLVLSGTAWTQSSFTVGPTVSSGTKLFPLNGRTGLGVSLEYAAPLSKQGSIRLYAGYDRFEHNFKGIDARVLQDSIVKMGINGYDVSFVPLRVGYMHFLLTNAAFVYVEAGVSHLFTPYKDWSTYHSNKLFTYAIGTGYSFTVQQSRLVQVSFFYNHNRLNEYSNRNYFSLRAAYGLRFGKTKK
jgi:hypothetical protein